MSLAKKLPTKSRDTLSNDNKKGTSDKQKKPSWKLAKKENKTIQEFLGSSSQEQMHLLPYAIDSMSAQFKMHAKREIIPANAADALMTAMDQIRKEISDGKFEMSHPSIYESISARVKQLAPKAHDFMDVARSDSYQAAGDFKMWVRNALHTLDKSMQSLQAKVIDRAEDTTKTLFPAQAHNNITQPTTMAHHLISYVEMLSRDRKRVAAAVSIMNESPFSSGEVAGNSFNLNREMVARQLSFNSASNNSVDAVASRDFATSFLHVAATCFANLSRMATEMLAWQSTRYGYVNFSSELARPNSAMPYRRDQLTLEAIKGKAGKAIGMTASALSIMKDAPMQASSEYDEMISMCADTFNDLNASLKAMSVAMSDFSINRKTLKEASSKQFSVALDLVDWIIQKSGGGRPQAEAKVRDIIDYALSKGKKLSLLEVKELQAIEPSIDDDVYRVLIPSRAVTSRRSGAGSNPVQVRKYIRAAKRNMLKN